MDKSTKQRIVVEIEGHKRTFSIAQRQWDCYDQDNRDRILSKLRNIAVRELEAIESEWEFNNG